MWFHLSTWSYRICERLLPEDGLEDGLKDLSIKEIMAFYSASGSYYDEGS